MGTRSAGRTKNHIGILIVVCIVVAAAGVCAFLLFLRENAVKRTAHISVDDATGILQDICKEEYDSIFDNEILGQLKYLHEEYGITASLYIFEQLDEFAVWDMPLTYKAEFRANADWLKLGFHSVTEDDPAESGLSFADFKKEYARTESAITRFAGGEALTHVLRLHYWYATEEMVAYLKEQGVTGLLCSDSEAASYNLTEEQAEKLYRSRDGKLEAEGMTYYTTDIRLELEEDIEAALAEHERDRVIVIFTHAWCFEENYDKLETAVGWLYERGYQFSDLEASEE